MNQQAMLRKVRQMQKEMEETQQEIFNTDFTQTAGGVVSVTMKGTKEITKVDILDGFEIESKEDYEMLSDMIIAACANCYKEIDRTTEEKMAKYQAFLGGMGMF